MKVLHIVPSFYPFVGGIESLVADLAQAQINYGLKANVVFPDRLKKFQDRYSYRNISVIPFKFPEVMIPWFMAGVPLDMKYSPKNVANIFAEVRRIIDFEKPSIVHIHNGSEIALPFLNISKSMAIPTVLHWHTTIHKGGLKPIERILLNQANSIVSVSRFVSNEISNYITRDTNVYNFANALDTKIIQSREKSEISQFILMAGRFSLEKGFDLGIKVFASIAEKYPFLQLHIAGNGPERKNLENLIEDLKLQDRVSLLGTLNRSTLYSQLKRAKCVLIPTPENEAFGLLAAEAMVCGVPIVATKVGGLPEVIDSGETGLIAEPNIESLGLALRKILDNPEWAEKLGSNASNVGRKKFNISRLNVELFKLYQSLIDS